MTINPSQNDSDNGIMNPQSVFQPSDILSYLIAHPPNIKVKPQIPPKCEDKHEHKFIYNEEIPSSTKPCPILGIGKLAAKRNRKTLNIEKDVSKKKEERRAIRAEKNRIFARESRD